MYITLNIGLSISKNYLPEGVDDIQWNYRYIKDYLAAEFGTPSCIGIAQSATEKTVVVKYAIVESVLYNLFRLAHELQQDYIAYTIQSDSGTVLGGALVGEYAYEWNYGIFDERYFIQATA